MRARRVFVTGTDTGVGKTWVTARLAERLRARGARVAALKAAESGCRVTPTGLVGEDDETLFAAAGAWQPERCRYLYEPAVAPGVAAEDSGHPIDFARIATQVEGLADLADVVLVEGAGGWLVPMGDGGTVADLAAHLEAPVLVAARAALGTINHSLLTVAAIRAAGLTPLGVAISVRPDDDPALTARNRTEIARHGRVPTWLVPADLDSACAAVLDG